MRFPIRLVILIIGTVTASAIVSVMWSRAQLPPGLIDNPALVNTELARERLNAWFNKRVPHPACPRCFKVDSGLEGIFEEVPGTDRVITRDLPDPAPLKPGEIRPTVHPETGEPLWYKGNQAFVGPTDEDPVSASLSIPLIEVKRIKYRHEAELFKIEGVHAVGIGEKGLVVSILPEKSVNSRFLPAAVEGIPVVIQEVGIPRRQSHQFTTFDPVPVGAGITSQAPSGGNGTMGPHVSRDLSDGIGYCCQLYSFTSGHVVQATQLPPGNVNGQRIILQGTFLYGYVAAIFQQNSCGSYYNCWYYGTPANDIRIQPDVAAIGHDGFDYYPMVSPCNGTDKPVRRMHYGVNDWKHGPTGIVRIPTFSSCSGKCLRVWGVHLHRTPARLSATETTQMTYAPGSGVYQIDYPLDVIVPTTASQGGDSGALIAWDETRDIAGLLVGGDGYYSLYERLDYIKTAFSNAGISFDHYWGTAATAYRPSFTGQDNPC